MENHVLCYVKRPLITKWKRLVLTRDEPLFVYASNDKGLFRSRLKKGGVLWVISSIPNRPPELVARLNIKKVRNRDKLVNEAADFDIHLSNFLQEFPFKWVAFGKEGSKFFGHNNAETALLQSAFRAEHGNPWKIDEGATQWQSKFGNKLQAPRFICEAGRIRKWNDFPWQSTCSLIYKRKNPGLSFSVGNGVIIQKNLCVSSPMSWLSRDLCPGWIY